MAKLTQPLGSTEARGKLGGLVYNTWRGISYVKAKATPGNQNTNRRLIVRALTKQCTTRWQSISDTQRADWNYYASLHPDPDWTGNPRRLSGFNYFVRANFRLLDVGLSILDDPPVRMNQFPLASLSAVASGSAIEISWTLHSGATPSQFQVDIWYTAASSAGRHPKIEDCKHKVYCDAEDGSHTTPELSRGSYGVFARTIDELTGLASPWLLVSVSLAEGVAYSQGPFLPSHASSIPPGDFSWEAIGNIFLEDAAYARVEPDATCRSENLVAFDFDFSIPAAATITGIKLDILFMNSAIADVCVQAWRGALVGDPDSLPLPVQVLPAWMSFGDSSELWGTSWTPAQINSSDFGFAVFVQASLTESTLFEIDCYTVTVYYTI